MTECSYFRGKFRTLQKVTYILQSKFHKRVDIAALLESLEEFKDQEEPQALFGGVLLQNKLNTYGGEGNEREQRRG
jgi:hypothetical protein